MLEGSLARHGNITPTPAQPGVCLICSFEYFWKGDVMTVLKSVGNWLVHRKVSYIDPESIMNTSSVLTPVDRTPSFIG